jgi:NAD-dependent deacetylase
MSSVLPKHQELIKRLTTANRVAVLTGAGISAESGIPTFRDEDGLWQKYDPQELATMEAFLQQPEVVQEWYEHRRSIIHDTTPNPAHRALVELESMHSEFTIITQNVDNLHQEAGSEKVIELHGNIQRNYCVDCEREASEATIDQLAEDQAPVRCPECNGLIRPDVVWFGEPLPEGEFEKASKVSQRCDVFLSIGTSAMVFPAAQLPITAKDNGSYLAEINTEPSDLTPFVDASVRGKAGELLPEIVGYLRERRQH